MKSASSSTSTRNDSQLTETRRMIISAGLTTRDVSQIRQQLGHGDTVRRIAAEWAIPNYVVSAIERDFGPTE
jgi:hypothetical protein